VAIDAVAVVRGLGLSPGSEEPAPCVASGPDAAAGTDLGVETDCCGAIEARGAAEAMALDVVALAQPADRTTRSTYAARLRGSTRRIGCCSALTAGEGIEERGIRVKPRRW